jgi:hypothetical protein
MKNLRITLLLVTFLSVKSMFAQEQKKDSVKDNFQLLFNYSQLSNLNKNVDNGQSYGITYLYGKNKQNGFISKIGLDMRLQLFGTSKTIDFNGDSLWSSNYSTPHKAGVMNNGISNFQIGVPISFGYHVPVMKKGNYLEFNLGATTYYTWSNLSETYMITDQGSTFKKIKTTDLNFIQQPINFNATASINYIFNKYWIIGLSTSYSVNSLYKTNYMRFNPSSVGVTLGFNINNIGEKDKKNSK